MEGTAEEITSRIKIVGEELKNDCSFKIIKDLIKKRDEASEEISTLGKKVAALQICLAEKEVFKKKFIGLETAFAQSRKDTKTFADSLRIILLQEKVSAKAKIDKLMQALGTKKIQKI